MAEEGVPVTTESASISLHRECAERLLQRRALSLQHYRREESVLFTGEVKKNNTLRIARASL